MKKLYYEDIRMTDFEAVVMECVYNDKKKLYEIVLDQTAFFPEEGGQVADKGSFLFEKQMIPVVDVQIKNSLIYHSVKSSLPVGCRIQGRVDWNQRFDFMQQHTGEHIISGLVNKYYGLNNVGFHLGLTEVTLDFDGVLTLEQLREIEVKANEAVWLNIAVEESHPDSHSLQTLKYRSKLELTEGVRIITIAGFDCCACCAPHVTRTGEIGLIKITAVASHRGGVRVNILCGGRALADYSNKQDNIFKISSSLSVKQDQAFVGVDRLKEEVLSLREQNNLLQTEILRNRTLLLPAPEESPHAFVFVEPMNDIVIRNVINDLTEKYPGYVAVFWGDKTQGYRYMIGSRNLDCRLPALELKEKFDAKGGGKAPMVQGTVVAAREVLEACLASW